MLCAVYSSGQYNRIGVFMDRTKLRDILAGTVTVLYMALLVVFVKDVGEAVLRSLRVCFEVMIPSLYAFMVASGFVVSSGLYAVLSKPFSWISRYVFRIPPKYFSVFLIGSVGGYPIGAKLLSELYDEKKIDRGTAEQMLSYCYLAGPAFICGAAGVKLFSSVKAGMIIFGAIIGANLVIAVISGLSRDIPPREKTSVKLELTFDKLIGSVYGGAKGMFSICAVIVFFSSIICILEKCGMISLAARKLSGITGMRQSDVSAAVKSVIEISNISSLTKNDYSLIPLSAALLSFGGLCVLMQVNGFLRGKLSAKRFYIFRIFAIFISYFLCKLYMVLFNVRYIPAVVSSAVEVRHNSPIPTLFLLIMTILLLSNIYMEKKKKV